MASKTVEFIPETQGAARKKIHLGHEYGRPGQHRTVCIDCLQGYCNNVLQINNKPVIPCDAINKMFAGFLKDQTNFHSCSKKGDLLDNIDLLEFS